MQVMEVRNKLIKKEILKLLYFNKYLSIAALSSSLNKSIPLILKIVGELIEEGVVIETGYAPSTGGRRAVKYSLKKGLQYIVAVSMDQFVTRIGLMDIDNSIIGDIQKIDLALAKNEDALRLLIAAIDDFIKASAISKEKIIGIGIAMPGFIDAKKGINYSFLESNKSICDLVHEATNIPAFIDNDSSLVALAELKFGVGMNKKNAMVINIGWGVGLGMILNSKLYRGENGFAGEFSHISLFSNNKLCSCGKMGCLETETSLLIIVEKAKQGLSDGRTSVLKDKISDVDIETAFETIVNAAKKGDQFAIELISKAAYEIGRGVSILIHLLNPELIILSGRGAVAGKLWRAPMQQAINEYSIPRLAAHTEIEISPLEHQSELIGAASLVMENLENISSKVLESALNIYQ
jgi:predicted NBD/HSP70 family sugar kinase